MPKYIAEPDPREPAYKRAERYVRTMIRNGTWPAGTRLPSSKAMADTLETSLFTVQTAFEHLCREGLLERKPRIGTHVRGGKVQLTCAGIYFGHDFWKDPEDAFNGLLCRELQKQWEERGIRTRIWIDDRREAQQTLPFPPLQLALKRREIQGLLGSSLNDRSRAWLKRAKIPMTFSMGAAVPEQVGFDWGQMIDSAMEQLRKQGCRTVGVISSCATESVRNGFLARDVDFYGAVKRAGLQTRDEWIQIPRVDPASREDYGYRAFGELWGRRSRPDGLFVFPDWAARGVVTGILAKRIDVPRQLKLVLHRSDQIPYSCPLPATYVVTQISSFAAGMISHLCRQIEGKPPRRVLFPLAVESPQVALPAAA